MQDVHIKQTTCTMTKDQQDQEDSEMNYNTSMLRDL